MSSNNSSESMNDDEGSDELSRNDEYSSEEEEEKEELWEEADSVLFQAVARNDAATVRQALRNGANVNCYMDDFCRTPLMKACKRGYDEIVRILLDAGADARRERQPELDGHK